MTVKLTTLAGGGGCGCKIAPAVLRDLLHRAGVDGEWPPELLVGADKSDDAAVWRLREDAAIVATADFFTPVVDDGRDFGRIAAANALSDIYAMGATPLFALALLAVPRDKIPPAVIADILGGGREICRQAGAVVAGGHSIEAAEPMYGLAAIGTAHPQKILTNAGARTGDVLILGKPLGVGVMSAAFKRGELGGEEYRQMVDSMTRLNRAGADFAELSGAHALTDVTGFGLLGHLLEICRASNCAAHVVFPQLPLHPAAEKFARRGIVTGASMRNWDSYGDETSLPGGFGDWQKTLLTDPQTGGGLLLSCAPSAATTALRLLHESGCGQAAVIGDIRPADGDGGGVTVCQ